MEQNQVGLSVPFLCALLLLLLFDPTGQTEQILLAAALHEGGHLLVMARMGHLPQRMVFGGFALMTLTQFTKGNDVTRNKLYRICGIIMIVALAVVPIRAILNWPDWLMMLLEFFMLEAFSVSWIVKSKVTM